MSTPTATPRAALAAPPASPTCGAQILECGVCGVAISGRTKTWTAVDGSSQCDLPGFALLVSHGPATAPF